MAKGSEAGLFLVNLRTSLFTAHVSTGINSAGASPREYGDSCIEASPYLPGHPVDQKSDFETARRIESVCSFAVPVTLRLDSVPITTDFSDGCLIFANGAAWNLGTRAN